jgi:hypothetical protein
MAKKKEPKQEEVNGPVVKRLDALLRFYIETNKGREGFTEAGAARILQSLGFTPTEIAAVLGKKSRTQVSKYLYSKKSKGTKKSKVESKPDASMNMPPQQG